MYISATVLPLLLLHHSIEAVQLTYAYDYSMQTTGSLLSLSEPRAVTCIGSHSKNVSHTPNDNMCVQLANTMHWHHATAAKPHLLLYMRYSSS
jgi:hypothetical protein